MIMKYTKPAEAGPDYDPSMIQHFAAQLYKKADGIETAHSIFGLLIGLFLVPAAFGVVGLTEPNSVKVAMVFGILGGFLIGRSIGAAKALQHRIEAQKALCFVQIEMNTRPL